MGNTTSISSIFKAAGDFVSSAVKGFGGPSVAVSGSTPPSDSQGRIEPPTACSSSTETCKSSCANNGGVRSCSCGADGQVAFVCKDGASSDSVSEEAQSPSAASSLVATSFSLALALAL